MDIYETEISIPVNNTNNSFIQHLKQHITSKLKEDEVPIRLAIIKTDSSNYHCDVGVVKINNNNSNLNKIKNSVFDFKKRTYENSEQFNIALLIPTGIDADIGGHSGDGGAVARLFGKLCDNLILHPNVVNAADINEMPQNSLYVEGSALCRLLMGTIGLQKVIANRVMLVMDKHEDEFYNTCIVNALNAARSSYGLDCNKIVQLSPSVSLDAYYTDIGKAIGTISHMDRLYAALDKYKGEYDAVALSTKIGADAEIKREYFMPESKLSNPWGGVEAIFTHAITSIYNIPAAHSPMCADEDDDELGDGIIVDSRKAAEVVSYTALQCILKGLQRSPKIVENDANSYRQGIVTANDVSCLIIPDNCLGLPTLAALEQGIKVIAVKTNTNLMDNKLKNLPWAPGQLITVNNYLEAAGVVSVLREGISLESVLRPLDFAPVETLYFNEQ